MQPFDCSDVEHVGVRHVVRFLVDHGFVVVEAAAGDTSTGVYSLGTLRATPYATMTCDAEDLLALSDRLKCVMEAIGLVVYPHGTADASLFSDSAPTVDLATNIEIISSYDPADGSSLITLLGLDDTKLDARVRYD